MGDLTAHFSWSEFACKDKARTPVPAGLRASVRMLAENLELIRAAAGGYPVEIVSGYRTPEHNKACGGAKASQHMQGNAADIRIQGLAPEDVHTLLLQLQGEGRIARGGIGAYQTFTHYDIRGYNARWSGAGVKDDVA